MNDDRLVVWGIGTARTIRVLWTALELGLDYEHRAIGPRTGETHTAEYMRLNPKQKIPTLQHGPVVISESAAIIQYLLEVFPQAMLDYQQRVARRPAYQRAMRTNYPNWFAAGASVPEPLSPTLQQHPA